MDTASSIKSPRFQLILLGLIGYFLIAIGGFWAFIVWVVGLVVMSRFASRESLRLLLKGGTVINLIVAVIVAFGFGTVHSYDSFWEELKHGVVEQLLLAAIVAVILLLVYGLNDGWSRDRTNSATE
jgi:hypothetical protein